MEVNTRVTEEKSGDENGCANGIGNGVTICTLTLGNGTTNRTIGNGTIKTEFANGNGVSIGNGVKHDKIGNGVNHDKVGNGVASDGVGNGVNHHDKVGNGVATDKVGNGLSTEYSNGKVGNGVAHGIGNGATTRLSRKDRGSREEVARALEELRLTTIRGNITGVQNALKKGVSVNQTLQGGWSPLMYACSMGHPDLAEMLLKEGANPNFHKELFTPLMAACASTRENENKLVRCVELLLSCNVDINAAERHRISALMFAAKEGHEKLVRTLARRHTCNLNLQDSQGWTALAWAVNQGRTQVVATLVQAGAKVHIKDRRGQTAFDLAMNKGLTEIAAILSTQHLSRELTDTSLDPLLDVSINTADPALSASLASLPSLDCDQRSDERHDSGAEWEILLNGLALPEHDSMKSPPISLSWPKRSASASPTVRDGRSGSGRSRSDSGSDTIFSDLAGGFEPSPRARKMLQNIRRFRLLRHSKKKQSLFHCPRNEAYSLLDAAIVLSSTVRHLSVLFASVSYVRLRIQGRPVDLPLDQRYAGTNGLAALSARALKQAELLRSEVQFLHQFAQQLDEADSIVPADVIVQKKEGVPTTTISSIFVLGAATAVLVWKLKHGPPALVWWWW